MSGKTKIDFIKQLFLSPGWAGHVNKLAFWVEWSPIPINFSSLWHALFFQNSHWKAVIMLSKFHSNSQLREYTNLHHCYLKISLILHLEKEPCGFLPVLTSAILAGEPTCTRYESWVMTHFEPIRALHLRGDSRSARALPNMEVIVWCQDLGIPSAVLIWICKLC